MSNKVAGRLIVGAEKFKFINKVTAGDQVGSYFRLNIILEEKHKE